MKKKTPPKLLYPIVLETFREPGAYGMSQFRQDDPSCFNGIVSVLRYRITVELIPEEESVIIARIKKLWKECDNHHHRDPLIRKAAGYGVDLHKPSAR